MPSSKRIWSLPLPVAPWQIATAPSLRAISTNFLAIAGRPWMYQGDICVRIQHLPVHMEQ